MWYNKSENIIDERRNRMAKTYKPGERASRSGQYEIIGPRGGRTGKERTVVSNEPFPPTPKAGQRYTLVDPTKNNSGIKRR